MDALTFVEAKQVVSLLLHYLDVIVSRFGFVDGVLVSADGAGAPHETQDQDNDQHPDISQGKPTRLAHQPTQADKQENQRKK